MRMIRLTLMTVTTLYVAGLTGYLLLQQVAPDAHWSIALLREFLAYGFVPAPALAVVALVSRQRSALVLLAVPALAFLALFGGLFLPKAGAQDGRRSFAVRSHNVSPQNVEATPEVEAIQQDAVDVVLLQESNSDFARELAEGLGDDYRYRALHPSADDRGYGVVSRHPIEYDECVRPIPESRCWQLIAMSVGGRRVTLVNVHALNPVIHLERSIRRGVFSMHYDVSLRQREMRAAVGWLDGLPRPLIVAGDFNAAPHSEAYDLLTQRLRDSYVSAGFGLGHTWPSQVVLEVWPMPQVVRIDYVFVSPDVRAIGFELGPSGRSDHYAVTARLLLPE